MAALGVVRAGLTSDRIATATGVLAELPDLVLAVQRELFVVAAELAANPDAADRLQDGVTRVDEAMVARLETILATKEARIEMPREFVVPGASRSSAALEVARTVVRRAERRVVGLQGEGHAVGPWVLPYLNRLADLLWVLARGVEQAEERTTTLARPETRRRRATRPPPDDASG